MSGLRLVARWYVRAARILFARAVWRRKHRRALRIASTPAARAVGKITAASSVAMHAVAVAMGPAPVQAPRRIRPFRSFTVECPRCGVKDTHSLGVKNDAWPIFCGTCKYRWDIPVEYVDCGGAA